MGMTIDEAIQRYKNNAEYERTHGNLQGCLEFRQLAKWLEELRTYRNMYHAENIDNCLREKVLEDGNDLPKGHGKLIAEPTEEDIAKTIGGQNDFAAGIRDAVQAVIDNAKPVTEQEIVKPYLEKLRAEIKALSPEPTAYDVVDGNPIKDAVWETLGDVLKIIDNYKAESEDKE